MGSTSSNQTQSTLLGSALLPMIGTPVGYINGKGSPGYSGPATTQSGATQATNKVDAIRSNYGIGK